ncbi:peptidyl-prolyl cis-trans isomerase FKBP8 [Orussus abietinus]|uniref:peptidyl-prolyl cis-trans isomerase FKBP8 n=1 Tax=Orussus abietinus TaxID=222816 RepID=UPI00062670CB|nr:peptidyl-prolyl cis-trans isomerase FKBP8 [Orussus abietinus]XP_012284027.1 peptidyl-prolyl cis-trans isomerase FKBP8 [Orussus abietinus]
MSVMSETLVQPGNTQADFIKKEMNFDVNPEDPMTKATLKDHEENETIDILGSGQLIKTVLKPGKKGTRPNKSDICTLKMSGKLEDGTIVEEYEELIIQLGDVEVVQGLDLAIALMDVGEVATIEVHSRFAYGDLGKEPNIPSNATIIYNVELKSVGTEAEVEMLGIEDRKKIGNKKRERGNWWFARDEPILAIQCYRRALDFLYPENGGTSYSGEEVEQTASDADLQALLEDRMKVYNNLAAAQIKTQAFDAALKSVENVLRGQPQNVKALFRKGKILHLKGEHTGAFTTLMQASKLDPSSKAIQQELAILREKNAKDARHEKNLYQKMLGTHKQNDSATSGKIRANVKSQIFGKLAWSVIGGTAAAVAGLLAYRYIS